MTDAGRAGADCVEFTVREFAVREKVTVKTVRRWIDKGAVEFRTTAGGGIRIVERRRREYRRRVPADAAASPIGTGERRSGTGGDRRGHSSR
jgi:hypothetical protein